MLLIRKEANVPMLSTTGQQMLDWTDTPPQRPAEADAVSAEPDGGTGTQSIVNKAVAIDDRDAMFSRKACPSPERFHLGFLSREQLIDEIITSNPSATVDFLSDFGDRGLRLYLTRLRSVQLGRGRHAISERVPESPAIVAHVRMI